MNHSELIAGLSLSDLLALKDTIEAKVKELIDPQVNQTVLIKVSGIIYRANVERIEGEGESRRVYLRQALNGREYYSTVSIDKYRRWVIAASNQR